VRISARLWLCRFQPSRNVRNIQSGRPDLSKRRIYPASAAYFSARAYQPQSPNQANSKPSEIRISAPVPWAGSGKAGSTASGHAVNGKPVFTSGAVPLRQELSGRNSITGLSGQTIIGLGPLSIQKRNGATRSFPIWQTLSPFSLVALISQCSTASVPTGFDSRNPFDGLMSPAGYWISLHFHGKAGMSGLYRPARFLSAERRF